MQALEMWKRKLQCRSWYWWKKAVNAAGRCPVCWSKVNYTTKGRAICPECGK